MLIKLHKRYIAQRNKHKKFLIISIFKGKEKSIFINLHVQQLHYIKMMNKRDNLFSIYLVLDNNLMKAAFMLYLVAFSVIFYS